MLRENGLGISEIIDQLKTGFRIDAEIRPGESTQLAVTPKEELTTLKARIQQYETRITTLQNDLQEKQYDIIRIKAERDLLRDLIEKYIQRDDK
jgi:uncharacterized coiled-coil DUF342 family protein